MRIQALPPDEVKSEFDLAMYEFNHKLVGLALTLDHTRKVTETAYRRAPAPEAVARRRR